MPRLLIALFILCTLSLTGCNSSYVTPGRGASMDTFGVPDHVNGDTPSIAQKLALQPTVVFPTAIAVARVQAPGYHSYSVDQTWGTGRYTVVTARDIESPKTVDRLSHLSKVLAIAPINHLLLKENLTSDADIREASASLHAQMTLIYTIDTVFKTEDYAAPLSVISLGLSPNRAAHVSTTATAVLMDTRTGYVYAVAEGTAKANQLSNAWTDDQAVDDARKRAEASAFDNMITELEKSWTGVLTQYGEK